MLFDCVVLFASKLKHLFGITGTHDIEAVKENVFKNNFNFLSIKNPQ